MATARLRAARSIPSSVPRVLLYHQRPVLYHGTVGVRDLSLLAGYWGRLQPPYAIVCPPTPSHHHLGSASFGTTLEPYLFDHINFSSVLTSGRNEAIWAIWAIYPNAELGPERLLHFHPDRETPIARLGFIYIYKYISKHRQSRTLPQTTLSNHN